MNTYYLTDTLEGIYEWMRIKKSYNLVLQQNVTIGQDSSLFGNFKGTLMQIWKSATIFVFT